MMLGPGQAALQFDLAGLLFESRNYAANVMLAYAGLNHFSTD
jgi:hypothetical protein